MAKIDVSTWDKWYENDDVIHHHKPSTRTHTIVIYGFGCEECGEEETEEHCEPLNSILYLDCWKEAIALEI